MSRKHVGNGLSIVEYFDSRWPELTVEVTIAGGGPGDCTALADAEVHALYSWCHDHLERSGYFARREAAILAEIEASKKK